MAEFAKLQNRGKKDRHACPGENYDSESSQSEHRLIIALNEKQRLLLSRDAGFAAPIELRDPTILCNTPLAGFGPRSFQGHSVSGSSPMHSPTAISQSDVASLVGVVVG